MSRLLVTQYQAEVEKIVRYGGSKQETSIRNASERLLNDYCKPRNYSCSHVLHGESESERLPSISFSAFSLS